MKNYILIANNIEELATTTIGKIIGIPFIVIGVAIIVISIFYLKKCLDPDEKFKKRIMILFLLFLVVIIGFLFGAFGNMQMANRKNYKSKKVVEYMKKEGIENIDPEKLVLNVRKIKQFQGVIPIKFQHCSRSCYYDDNAYYNELLNNYYNDIHAEELLYNQLEK